MFSNTTTIIWILIVAITCLIRTGSAMALAQQAMQVFRVKDGIELTTLNSGDVRFSPDSNYFVVYTERGRLDLDRCENSLRFYRSEEVKDFLENSDQTKISAPVWVVSLATSKTCSTINDWRWLANSSGVAFLQRGQAETQSLVLADLNNHTVEHLSSPTEAIRDFDIRDRKHFVYTVTDPAQRQKGQAERGEPLIVATGRDFWHLFFPDEERRRDASRQRINLWAVVDGKRFQVNNKSVPLAFAGGGFALSPDGRTLVATLPVRDVPLSWETLYPPSDQYSTYKLHSGHQDISELNYFRVDQYVRIDLETGAVRALIDAPSSGVGWWTQGNPSWSSDGEAILLPGTFILSEQQAPSLPCVAVVELISNSVTCVERLKKQNSADSMLFVGGDRHRIRVIFYEKDGWGAREYQKSSAGEWRLAQQIKKASEAVGLDFELAVKQSLNEPPMLVGTSKQISRVILDPNPQLKNLQLGAADVYTWKAKDGSVWRGGLYKPSHYEPGKRYPLVIQTHGFFEQFYRPSGAHHTAFAARALAAEGIMVLQVDDDSHGCPMNTSGEAPCAASGYEAAGNELVSQGLVDPEKIGIIGFSHSCYWVMETLTRNPLRVKAASITDGVMADYNQYLMGAEFSEMADYSDKLIGARPIGQGLHTWLERSPGFNLERVSAALLVVGEGPESLLTMWQPYAILHLLGKPVELVMLNTTEHDLSNPAIRLASQGGSVDWFRFWLQNYEDPDPAKAEQYERWRELRKLQQENDAKDKAANGKPAPVN